MLQHDKMLSRYLIKCFYSVRYLQSQPYFALLASQPFCMCVGLKLLLYVLPQSSGSPKLFPWSRKYRSGSRVGDSGSFLEIYWYNFSIYFFPDKITRLPKIPPDRYFGLIRRYVELRMTKVGCSHVLRSTRIFTLGQFASHPSQSPLAAQLPASSAPEVAVDNLTSFRSHGHTRRKLGHTLLQTFALGGVATVLLCVRDNWSKERKEGKKKNEQCDDLMESNEAMTK